jgi:hypothetical protein
VSSIIFNPKIPDGDIIDPIEEARIEERKAIGELLKQSAGVVLPDKDSSTQFEPYRPIPERIITILRRGERPKE